MRIRREAPEDHATVRQVVESAFAKAEMSDGAEQDLVERLRKGAAFIPELSLVAEDHDGRIVGHVMFTRAHVAVVEVLALAPLSVHPDHWNQGIGSALVRAGHAEAKRLGFGWSVVLGSSRYYPRFGYKPAAGFGIKAPFEAPNDCFMAVKLMESAPELQGVMEYAPEFGI